MATNQMLQIVVDGRSRSVLEGLSLIEALRLHGRNPIDLMFMGSTTHQIVWSASCPVLTLRA